MLLNSKTALITGGATGIGAGISRCLIESGCRVAIVDIDPQTGEATALALGPNARFYALDISQEPVVNEVVDNICRDFGKIDILINNAGITRDKLMLRMTVDDWQKVININLNGTFYVTRAVAKHMIKQRYGRIVNIASVIGLIGNAGQANYAASKAGIIGLTKSCAREFASRNITVNAIAPGFIQTRMTDILPEEVKNAYLKNIPLGRFGTPEDVAKLVRFLVSDDASYITGQVIPLDGGMVMQ